MTDGKKLFMGLKMQYYRYNFLSQIKEEQKNIDMSLFEEVFAYKEVDKMLQTLHNLKRVDSYNKEAFSTY